MSISQAFDEHRPRKAIPHWKRRKMTVPQHEFAFAADAFRLIGETMPAPEPERVQPEKAAELFAVMRDFLSLPHSSAPRAS